MSSASDARRAGHNPRATAGVARSDTSGAQQRRTRRSTRRCGRDRRVSRGRGGGPGPPRTPGGRRDRRTPSATSRSEDTTHDRPTGRLGPHQPADQLVGGLPRLAEQHPHPAGATPPAPGPPAPPRRSSRSPRRRDRAARLRQAGQQPGALLLQRQVRDSRSWSRCSRRRSGAPAAATSSWSSSAGSSDSSACDAAASPGHPAPRPRRGRPAGSLTGGSASSRRSAPRRLDHRVQQQPHPAVLEAAALPGRPPRRRRAQPRPRRPWPGPGAPPRRPPPLPRPRPPARRSTDSAASAAARSARRRAPFSSRSALVSRRGLGGRRGQLGLQRGQLVAVPGLLGRQRGLEPGAPPRPARSLPACGTGPLGLSRRSGDEGGPARRTGQVGHRGHVDRVGRGRRLAGVQRRGQVGQLARGPPPPPAAGTVTSRSTAAASGVPALVRRCCGAQERNRLSEPGTSSSASAPRVSAAKVTTRARTASGSGPSQTGSSLMPAAAPARPCRRRRTSGTGRSRPPRRAPRAPRPSAPPPGRRAGTPATRDRRVTSKRVRLPHWVQRQRVALVGTGGLVTRPSVRRRARPRPDARGRTGPRRAAAPRPTRADQLVRHRRDAGHTGDTSLQGGTPCLNRDELARLGRRRCSAPER